MPDDAFELVLRLVGEGRLSAVEAGPILDALEAGRDSARRPGGSTGPAAADRTSDGSAARALRVEVTERGRTVLNLRIPISLGRAALEGVPGLSDVTSERIREAIAAGIKGPIMDLDDDGDGVRISIE